MGIFTQDLKFLVKYIFFYCCYLIQKPISEDTYSKYLKIIKLTFSSDHNFKRSFSFLCATYRHIFGFFDLLTFFVICRLTYYYI